MTAGNIKDIWEKTRALERQIEEAKLKTSISSIPIPDEIIKATNNKELERALKDLGVIKDTADVDLSKCSYEEAKNLCEVTYKMKEVYSLEPLETLKTDRLNKGVAASSNAMRLRINQSFYGKNGKKEIIDLFERQTINYTQNKRDLIGKYIKGIRYLSNYLKTPGLSPYLIKSTQNDIKKYKKDVTKLWDKYKNYSCFTIERSAETYMEDTILHEYGHIMHDQILGGINYIARNTTSFIDDKTVSSFNRRAKDLFDKYYKENRRWLSEYGFSDWQEFIAESNVLFINNDPRLPRDVRDWFIDVIKLAKKRP